VWGGSAYTDNCSRCVGGNTGAAACTQDCNDVWGGSAYVDNCGRCAGGNTGNAACTQDCAGLWGGSAYFDNCGTCDNDSRNDCTQDCAGTWGGSAYIGTWYRDGDGDGLGGNTSWTGCSSSVPSGYVSNNDDFDDTCFYNIYDECGVCGGDGSTCAECQFFEHTCDNGQCVLGGFFEDLVCNGIADCDDGSDETGCDDGGGCSNYDCFGQCADSYMFMLGNRRCDPMFECRVWNFDDGDCLGGPGGPGGGIIIR
jgi:hypothetical protein